MSGRFRDWFRGGGQRAEWAAHTAATRAIGQRAREEAERRGLDIGNETDRVTASEYLARELLDADRATRRADDPHRVITESDIADPVADQARHLFAADDRSPSLDHPPLARTAGAHATITERPNEIEMTASLAAARSAAAVIADRKSQDAAAEAASPEPPPARRSADRAATGASVDASQTGAVDDAAL